MCRRADRADQQARLAEQSKQGSQDSVQQAEGQVAVLTKQLHQARQDHSALQKHFEVNIFPFPELFWGVLLS